MLRGLQERNAREQERDPPGRERVGKHRKSPRNFPEYTRLTRCQHLSPFKLQNGEQWQDNMGRGRTTLPCLQVFVRSPVEYGNLMDGGGDHPDRTVLILQV